MRRALLGIDIGSTNTKVVAFSADGTELAKAGLTSDAGPGHLARAVMEGIAYECQRLLECLFDEFSLDVRTLAAPTAAARASSR